MNLTMGLASVHMFIHVAEYNLLIAPLLNKSVSSTVVFKHGNVRSGKHKDIVKNVSLY